ncbi:GNAT family N-acetyltransferase [Chromobacterium sphagni]|uniref:GNAT family N-acetyltransferase n=1 Tax=Chromobacterium sphagni TaxID=1903179 RepID=UPI0009F4530C|nr:GNAT family N-acetyltransferase [Chromobacterium sphagni]
MPDATLKDCEPMQKQHWPIRRLKPQDIAPGWLDGFVRRQLVDLVYRAAPGGGRLALAEPFVDDWSNEERRGLCRELARIAARGLVLEARLQGRLAGFAAIAPERLGPEGDYLQLTELQVARSWRGRGLGRALLQACAAGGRELGAGRLYVSSHSAIETVAFYERCGCEPACWLHPAQLEREPFDWQMELNLARD